MKYRATLGYNVRTYRHAVFEATNDQEAEIMAASLNEWDPIDEYDNDFEESHIADSVIMLDEIFEDGSIRDVSDEIETKDQKFHMYFVSYSPNHDLLVTAETAGQALKFWRTFYGLTDEANPEYLWQLPEKFGKEIGSISWYSDCKPFHQEVP